LHGHIYLKGIPQNVIQHWIELDTTVPLAHQTRYQLSLNYVVIVKQNINKLLVVGFVKPVEKTTWLSSIVVVPKKNGKLRICVDFKKLNNKKNPLFVAFHI
jgi:hypothetical protein